MKRCASKSFAIWVGVVALAVALVALVATGCGSASDETIGTDTTTTSIDDTAATLALTKADNGKSLTLKVGDTVSVVLEGNATTGYMWESAMAEQASPILTLNNNEGTYAQDNVGSDIVGAGGKYTFVFTAVAAGQVELKLKYWRPFEAQSEPLETFGVNLTIQ